MQYCNILLSTLLFPAQTDSVQSHEDIAWSSSDSDQSDDGSHELHLSRVTVQQRERRPTAPIQGCSKVPHKPSTDEGTFIRAAESGLDCHRQSIHFFSCSLLLFGDYVIKHVHIFFFYLMFNFVSFLSVEDPPVIDTDSDLNEEDCEKDSGQQISDCDSKSCDENSEASPLKLTNVSELNLF